MSKYFINRPIFAWVLAIIVMLVGVISIKKMPIEQYPNVAPTAIQIQATYPGADATTLQNSVTQVIEQNMSGLDGLLYMSSSSDSTGNVQIILSFQTGVDADIAQVQVQNKLQVATPSLPQEVQQQGVTVRKSSNTFFLIPAFYDETGKMSMEDIADYISSNLKDPISRINGVGDTTLFGSQYAMRVWLDPNKLNAFQLTPLDVNKKIEQQNAQIAAGQLGGAPAVKGQQLNASIIAQTRLSSPEQFGNILLKVNSDGSQVRLHDVAKVERGGESFNFVVKLNGKPASALGIQLAAGSNALDTANKVRATINALVPHFPHGLKVLYPWDTTPFISISLHEVVKTLFEAIVLVFLVMYLFLQNFRATLIPTIAVPVVLLGTFGILSAFGYSINTLTMFGMVLAIGLLVDDAIVVVENVERIMAEEGLSPKAATRKSTEQIQGALVGIALVLSAVFVPMAFFGGSTGVIYRQFSITIISAMGLSVLVALILTPALCVTLLKPHQHGETGHQRGFFAWFNRQFDKSTDHYTHSVSRMLSRSGRYLIIYGGLLIACTFLYKMIPASFLPSEDQGVIATQALLPAGATQERTQKVLDQINDYYLNDEKDSVRTVLTINGYGFAGRAQNIGIAFTGLKDWSIREDASSKVDSIATRANKAFTRIIDANVVAFNLPPIIELGNASGFDFELIDRDGLGHEQLMKARNTLLALAAQHPDVLTAVRPNGMEDTPQYKVNIDQEKATTLGVDLGDINDTLSTAWGGSYVNDFMDHGRVKKVYVMSDASYRMLPTDLDQWYVRATNGKMVPFSAFANTEWQYGSPRLERYNGLSSLELLGQPAPGKSSGQAMDMMETLTKQLPAGIGFDWTGMSYQERATGQQAPVLYAISILVVFLCLAALYESWSVPFSVMMVVPLGVLGVLIATLLRGLSNDVYFVVGLLTTIGLSAKNAILIVEFAKDEIEQHGKGIVESTLNSVRMRLRPILMTSMAFILGVLPLAISNGAGSGAQNAVGTGVIGGMVAATLLAIYFVPIFFVVIRKRFPGKPLEGEDDN